MRARNESASDPKRQRVVTEQAWDKLVSVQYIDNALLRQEIALSWQRCLSQKVNPRSSRTRTRKDYLIEKSVTCGSRPAARQQLYGLVTGTDYIVMLAGRHGTLLRIGDRNMYSIGEALKIVAGRAV